MHELSVAMSIVDVAGEEALRQSGRVTAVHLRMGPLSGVLNRALVSAYELACEGTPLQGSRLVVREMPIVAWCSACRREQEIPSPQRLCCPACGSPVPEIRGGNELEITGLEVQDDLDYTNCRSAPAGAQAQ